MKVVIYTQNNCQFTPQEKAYLTSKGVTFEERNVETNKEFLDEMMKLGANFAGTPVTQIVKDDGTTSVLKGFTQTEFDAALGATVAVANSDMNVPATPAPDAVVPTQDPATPPTPVEPPAPAPEPTPMPEPTPAPVEPPVQAANADMNVPAQPPADQPVVPPMPEPSPMPEPAPMPTPEPVQPPAPVEPTMQTANADMNLPSSGQAMPPADQPVAPPAPEPVPEPVQPPMPAPAPEPATPPTQTPSDTSVQAANNPLDAILADLQQKVSAASQTTQAANADMTMPAATPPQQPMPDPVAPTPSPEPAPMPEPTPPAPAAPSTDLPNVPDFK